MTVQATRATPRTGGSDRGTAPRKARFRGWVKPRAVPYLMVLPAILLELLIHIVPMLVGIWMSFVELTQFYIANWTAATPRSTVHALRRSAPR